MESKEKVTCISYLNILKARGKEQGTHECSRRVGTDARGGCLAKQREIDEANEVVNTLSSGLVIHISSCYCSDGLANFRYIH